MAKCGSCGDSAQSSVISTPADATCGDCAPSTPCEQDHTQVIVKKKFNFVLRVTAPFVWPASGESVTFPVDSVDGLGLGAVLWNITAGYLHVTGFNSATQEVTAENQGETCNIYVGGETLPSCLDFTVGPPSCGTGVGPLPNTPYLSADFISSAPSTCALAKVTTIVGLAIADVISINGYQYRIGDIPDSETIQLCNDGDGAAAGTVIAWDANNDGIPDIPVLVISSQDPCTRDSVIAGTLIVCASGIMKPFEGQIDGQIAVWNAATSKWELRNTNLPEINCAILTVPLTVDPAHVGSYVVIVSSSAAFTMNDTSILGGAYFNVDSVDDATTMHITPLVTPGSIFTYVVGTAVCIVLDDARSSVNSQEAVIVGPTGLAIHTTQTVGPVTLTIANTSLSKPMSVLVNYTLTADILADLLNIESAHVFSDIEENINGAGYIPVAQQTVSVDSGGAPASYQQDCAIPRSKTYTVAPGDTLVLLIKGTCNFAAGNAADTVLIAQQVIRASYIGVAV